jgi:hypothetical protein
LGNWEIWYFLSQSWEIKKVGKLTSLSKIPKYLSKSLILLEFDCAIAFNGLNDKNLKNFFEEINTQFYNFENDIDRIRIFFKSDRIHSVDHITKRMKNTFTLLVMF